jgi:hypothetical protein
MLWWGRYGFDRKRFRTHYAELVFLYPLGSVDHVVHSGASEVRNIDSLFFRLEWDRYGNHKNCVGTCYTEPLFLHAVGYAGHVVPFGASRERIIDTIFF